MENKKRSVAVYAGIFITFALFMAFCAMGVTRDYLPSENIVFSDFLQRVNNGQIVSVTIAGNEVFGKTSSGSQFKAV